MTLESSDYKKAIFSQTACNLSGIVFEFARVMQKICDEAGREGHGTDWKNTHPICVLYAEQILHLSGGSKKYFEAHKFCEERKGE
jgi:hypothetical protein